MKRNLQGSEDTVVSEKKQLLDQLPNTTNINEWNNLNDFYKVFHKSSETWKIIEKEEELIKLLYNTKEKNIIVISPTLFNKFYNHFDILFGKMCTYITDLSINGIPFKLLGSWYLIIRDLRLCNISIEGPENQNVVVGINFQYHENKPYLFKWQNPNVKYSSYDRLLYMIRNHNIIPTYLSDV